jgi:hypothetical protein
MRFAQLRRQFWNLGSWWSLNLLHEQAEKRSGGSGTSQEDPADSQSLRCAYIYLNRESPGIRQNLLGLAQKMTKKKDNLKIAATGTTRK